MDENNNYDDLVGIDTTVPTFGDIHDTDVPCDAINIYDDDINNNVFLTYEPAPATYPALSINNNIVFSMQEKIWTGFEYKFSGESKEALKITPNGFYCLGKRVDDINNIYEKFSAWVNNTIILTI